MTKTLVASLAALITLCGPALADPAPPVAMKFKIAVTDGSDVRTYQLSLLSDSCSFVEDHAGDRVDEVKLCLKDATPNARLGTHWKLRTKTIEQAVDFEAVIAKGKSIEAGRDKG